MGRIHDAVEEGVLQTRPDLRNMLRHFVLHFDITWGRSMHLFGSDIHAFMLHPQKEFRNIFGFEKEILLIHHQYLAIQPRIFHIANEIMLNGACAGRVEPLVFLLVTQAPNAEERVRSLSSDTAQHRVVVPFTLNECNANQQDSFVQGRLSKYLFDRDLFDVSKPLGSDLYFFGRNPFVLMLRDTVRRGENIGLFGLRRTGKTSLLLRLQRLLEAEGAGRFLYVDLEDAGLYQLRWWKLLEYIAKKMPHGKDLSDFSEEDAAEKFRTIVSKQKKNQSFVVALDEIEHITPGEHLRMRSHWDSDFVEFWKTLRAIQNVNRHVCFIVCGTNATPIETSTYGQRDNPLFGMSVRHYVPSFNKDEIRQMVRTLGRFMGLDFDDGSADYLKARYGGHPFITRQACSALFKILEGHARPIAVTTAVLERTESQRDLMLFSQADNILNVLRRWYPQEYSMLEYIAAGDTASFTQVEKDIPELSAHLRAYDLVSGEPASLTYGFVGAFLRNKMALQARNAASERKPATSIGSDSISGPLEIKLAAVGISRNRLEIKLRAFIKRIFIASKGPGRWIDPVMSSLPSERREKLVGIDRDEILNTQLFLLDLIQIIIKNWSAFQSLEQQAVQQRVTKAQFEVLLCWRPRNADDRCPMKNDQGWKPRGAPLGVV